MLSLDNFLEHLQRGEIPPRPPDGTSPRGSSFGDIEHYAMRGEATDRGMWAIVDQVWTKRLAKWIGNRTCLEIMAGAGWLAKALHDHGIDIVATDSGAWDASHKKMAFVHEVEKLDGRDAVKKYADRDILIVSWPPCNSNEICDICSLWNKDKPIVYIGEDEGGCNAPDEFWSNFTRLTNQPSIPLMSWPGLHDTVIFGNYEQKTSIQDK